MLNSFCEELEDTGSYLIDYLLVGEELDVRVDLWEALHHCPRHDHDLYHIDLSWVPQVKKDKHEVDLMLYHLCIMHKVLLIRLPKVCQKDQNTEHLQDIHHFVPLSVFNFEKFVEPFALVGWIEPKWILHQFKKFGFTDKVREAEPLFIDVSNQLIEAKWWPVLLVNNLTYVLRRVQLLCALLKKERTFSFKFVSHILVLKYNKFEL